MKAFCCAVATAVAGIAGLAVTAEPAAASTTTVYASPAGGGTACTQSAPCSLSGAQAFVRNIGANMTGDISVQLADGTYRLSQPMSFTAADSGTNGHTVTWGAAPGAHPVISGARKITGWTLADSSKNIWVANIGTGNETRQLSVDGVLATRARISVNRTDVSFTDTGLTINNSALNYLANAKNQSRIELDAIGSWTNRYSPVQSISGTTITMQQPAWSNNLFGWDTIASPFRSGPLYLENAYEFLSQPGQWYNDTAAGNLYYIPKSGQSMTSADVELPTLEALLSVGGTLGNPAHNLTFTGLTFTGNSWLAPSSPEGYVDQQSGGYIQGSGLAPANPRTTCSRGCEAIEATRPNWSQLPAAVQVSAANKIAFIGDTFTGIGSDALGIGQDNNAVLAGVGLGASNISVINSNFSQIAAGGITIGGMQADAHHPSDPRMINQNFTITGNTIQSTGIDYRDSMGILATYTTNATISHNEVFNVPYTGIALGFGWGVNDPGGSPDYLARGLYNHQPIYTTPTTAKNNTLSNNYVHNYMQQLHDGGCFYTLSANPGTQINNNHCSTGGTFGIYFDEGSRFMTAQNNVFDKSGPWLNENGASNNNTGNQTLLNNWTNNATQRIARDDTVSGTTVVSGTAWGCGARQVKATAGPQGSPAPTSTLYDAVNAPYTTTSTTTSTFGQCNNQFGITTTGPSSAGSAAQDAAYAAISNSGSFDSTGSLTVHVDNVPTGGKAGLLVRNTASNRTSTGYFSAALAGNAVIVQWDANNDGTLDSSQTASLGAAGSIWLKITRSGNTFTASYSRDGSTYTAVGTGTTIGSAATTQDAAVFASQASGTTGTTQLSSLKNASGPYKTFGTGKYSSAATSKGFTLTGAGSDTWVGGLQHDDYYTSAYLPGGLASSATATVQVASQQKTSPYAKAGLMVRNSIPGAGSSQGYAILAVTPGYGVVLESDSNGDGYLETESRAAITATTPMNLRLIRSGASVTGQYSTNGTTWTNVGTATLSGAASTEDVGVFSLSHSAESATASFGPLTVTPAASTAGPLTAFSTNSGTASGTSTNATITGAGADTWGGPPQHDDDYTAYFVPGGMTDSSTTTVQVASQQNTNKYAKAGLMVRNSIKGAGSSQGYAILAVTPGYGVVLESDANGDGYLESESRAAITATTPMSLRLTRSGSTLTGQYSKDGTTWTTVGTVTLSGAASTLDVGMFSLSHNTSVVGTSTFKAFTVTN